jgi:hypothetical protein
MEETIREHELKHINEKREEKVRKEEEAYKKQLEKIENDRIYLEEKSRTKRKFYDAMIAAISFDKVAEIIGKAKANGNFACTVYEKDWWDRYDGTYLSRSEFIDLILSYQKESNSEDCLIHNYTPECKGSIYQQLSKLLPNYKINISTKSYYFNRCDGYDIKIIVSWYPSYSPWYWLGY